MEPADTSVDQLPLKSLLFPGGDKDLVNTDGVKVTSDEIEGKILGIFVGPAWWKSLLKDRLLPSFADVIEEICDQGKELQMVFVPTPLSADLIHELQASNRAHEIESGPEEESFSSFIKSLPARWRAVPPSNVEAVQALRAASKTDSQVTGLAFVAADGQVITTSGMDILIEWRADSYPFTKEHLEDLDRPFAELKKNPTLKGLLERDGRDYLVKNDGTQVKVSSLEGPIALYFSAHWCGPCRKFTPDLIECYNQLKSEGKPFEIVFVSWDVNEQAFDEYFATMPWLSLPYSDKKANQALYKVYDVQGVPSLVILDSDAQIIQEDAVTVISAFDSRAYPFTDEKVEEMTQILEAEKEAQRASQSLESLLVTAERDFVVDHDSKEVKVSSLVGKTVGLYFSAHWCPPCRGFTPKLIAVYEQLKQQGKPFEIIFISSDRDEEAFNKYYGSMPWLALPYSDRQPKRTTKQKLSEYFDVKGIPTLVILGPDGKTLNKEGRKAIETFGAEGFPFAKEKEIELNKAVDDEMEKRQQTVTIPQHPHILTLSKVPYPRGSYTCDLCSLDVNRWAYRCAECGFDVDVACIDKELQKQAAQEKEEPGVSEEEAAGTEDSETTRAAEAEVKEGWVCDGDVCHKA
ncbi:nucleoredoxin [Marchantia polymorpha subsp. ruderalis]|uniref:protein-disulfide reductase n=2 Tax=Marchantia polymorpha TaxID=3197 RepID=A0AAF6B2V3_MARPO|nr:hypothetical protein MARPO_0049s0009 [Marchantia polymorpha]BBN06337.1 hypothetical protein Mp_3g20240 [Marchantia polymorpha subsp. ruderalis]|eukprot:PTQ38705.1 hypothetical protein MARPO_0049s0009 [Marchantia polymorpha]